MNWISLTDLNQLNEVSSASHQKNVIIFKHSTRCSVSRMALKQFERAYDIVPDKADAYLLDLLNHREVSNQIASKFHVVHQSPQLLLIENGEVIFEATHAQIDASELKSKIK